MWVALVRSCSTVESQSDVAMKQHETSCLEGAGLFACIWRRELARFRLSHDDFSHEWIGGFKVDGIDFSNRT